MRLVKFAFAALCLAAPAWAAGKPIWEERDDFAAAAPRWDMPFGYDVQNGALRADGAGRNFALWQSAPFAKAVALEAKITPHATQGSEWKTGGIGLFADEKNYWHLAFVEAPAAQNKRRFVELSEMLDGNWNAHFADGSRLTTIEEGPAFEWQFDQTYTLKIALSGGAAPEIRGEVFEGETLRYRAVRRLDARAVTAGRPMITNGGFIADFDDARAQVFERAAEPPKAEIKIPPFQSSLTQGTSRATGFFRVEQSNGAWWLVDPKGNRTLSIGTDHVNYHVHHSEKLGYAPYHRVVQKKFGSAEKWAADATRRLRSWNFNVLGANNSPETRYQGLAHTEFVAFGSEFSGVASLVEKTFWTGFPDVFDPRWEKFCDWKARQRCLPLKNDPWLLGYFLDNELEWWGKTHTKWGIAVETAKLPAEAAGKKALAASLRDFYQGDAAAFNADFATTFDGVLAWKELPKPQSERAQNALMNFVALVAQKYFAVTTAAIRKYDPNHLILGNRFAHDAPEAAWREAGKTCDIVTVNVYPRVDMARQKVIGLDEHLRSRFALCNKPLIITEWSFPALDAKDSEGRPLPSRHGAGMRVDNQAQKARCYAIMQRALFEFPFVVGSHYFMWGDEPALGISSSFPEDSNYGLVSESDEAYPELTQTATRVNALMPQLHSGKIKSAQVPIPDAPQGNFKFAARVPGEVKLTREGANFTIENGALKIVKNKAGGEAFDAVFWRKSAHAAWREVGYFRPLLQLAMNGQNQWTPATKVDAVQVREQTPQKLVLEMNFSVENLYKTAYRFTIEAGQPYFKAQCLWVENAGAQRWELGAYFHYALPRLNGDAADDEPGGAGVPNYYLSMAAWRDASGLQFGVLLPGNYESFNVTFWKDSGFHADAWRKIGTTLAPGARWSAAPDEPVVLVFGGVS